MYRYDWYGCMLERVKLRLFRGHSEPPALQKRGGRSHVCDCRARVLTGTVRVMRKMDLWSDGRDRMAETNGFDVGVENVVAVSGKGGDRTGYVTARIKF
jgi:hypothetical protein